jgi:hypothetical protein
MSRAFIRKRRRRLGPRSDLPAGDAENADLVVVVERPAGMVVEEAIPALQDERHRVGPTPLLRRYRRQEGRPTRDREVRE